MGEAKRRKSVLGEKYGEQPYIYPWLPITKTQSEQFIKWTTTGAWTGIVLLAVIWVTIRVVGPGLGWWHVD
ncbi:MAG: DUF2839 domain-containing protein [Coleofasciculaceae cyanobacterium SM2_1_6]|nr:DUF2839 domain-containing protein [Coleofasciculaceae cyanobacterium SM2_1_6]